MDNPETFLGALRTHLTAPVVLLLLEALGRELQQEQAGPPLLAKGVLKWGLPVCWGHFLFSGWFVLGALGGRGLALEASRGLG